MTELTEMFRKGWCIKSPNGSLKVSSLDETRDSCVLKFLGLDSAEVMDELWEKYEKRGWDCVRVLIGVKEIGNEPPPR